MPRWFQRVVLIGASAILIPGGAFSTYLFLCQEEMIYHPRSYGKMLMPSSCKELHYRTSQGGQVSYYLPPQAGGAPRRLWILFAGNASLALEWQHFIPKLHWREDGFLLVEYPGYGRCEGKPSPAAILEGSEAALRELEAQMGALPQRLDVMGHSLGAAAALQFAAQHETGQIVLAAPFTSLNDMAKRIVGRPFAYLLKHDFDNRSMLARIAGQAHPPKVTIFHGLDDDLIPPSMGQELAELHPGFVRFRPVPDGRHESILYDAVEQIAEL